MEASDGLADRAPDDVVKATTSAPRRRALPRGLGSQVGKVLPAVALLAMIFGAWQLAVHIFDINPTILPAPSEILKTAWESRDILWSDFKVTIVEVLVGFAIGFVCGVLLAALIASSSVLERSLYPLAVGSQTIPIFAIAPLLVIWFGFGLLPKVIVVALIVFFPITVTTVEGLRSAEPEMIALMRSLPASRWQIFRMIQIPASLPYVVAGTQVGVAYSVAGAMIGEWVGATEGLGARMLAANSLLRTDLVFAAILVLSLMALALFVLVIVIGRLVTPWKRVQGHG